MTSTKTTKFKFLYPKHEARPQRHHRSYEKIYLCKFREIRFLLKAVKFNLSNQGHSHGNKTRL